MSQVNWFTQERTLRSDFSMLVLATVVIIVTLIHFRNGNKTQIEHCYQRGGIPMMDRSIYIGCDMPDSLPDHRIGDK